ncbi:hypothetical protein LCGC14_0640810, partial [marine sediment metagenome]
QFHIGNEYFVRPVGMKPDMKIDEMVQPVERAPGYVVLVRLKQFFHVIVEKIEQQCLLVRRIVIKRTGLHADLGRDGAHRNGSISVVRKKTQGCIAHLGASNIRMGAGRTCHIERLIEHVFKRKPRLRRKRGWCKSDP